MTAALALAWPSANDNAMASEEAFPVGMTWENAAYRVHRFHGSIVVTELAGAGRRGKRCREIVVRSEEIGLESIAMEYEHLAVRGVAWERMLRASAEHAEIGAETHLQKLRGVDVQPAGEREVKVRGAYIAVESSPREFIVRCLRDTNNEPCLMSPAKRTKSAAAAFYRWAVANEARLETMRFEDVAREISQAGIGSHRFCAMD